MSGILSLRSKNGRHREEVRLHYSISESFTKAFGINELTVVELLKFFQYWIIQNFQENVIFQLLGDR